MESKIFSAFLIVGERLSLHKRRHYPDFFNGERRRSGDFTLTINMGGGRWTAPLRRFYSSKNRALAEETRPGVL
jgi:hypothetical protein